MALLFSIDFLGLLWRVKEAEPYGAEEGKLGPAGRPVPTGCEGHIWKRLHPKGTSSRYALRAPRRALPSSQ